MNKYGNVNNILGWNAAHIHITANPNAEKPSGEWAETRMRRNEHGGWEPVK